MADQYISVCLKCGSTNLSIDLAKLGAPMVIARQCRDCGYFGMCPEVEISKVKNFKNKLNCESNSKNKVIRHIGILFALIFILIIIVIGLFLVLLFAP